MGTASYNTAYYLLVQEYYDVLYFFFLYLYYHVVAPSRHKTHTYTQPTTAHLSLGAVGAHALCYYVGQRSF